MPSISLLPNPLEETIAAKFILALTGHDAPGSIFFHLIFSFDLHTFDGRLYFCLPVLLRSTHAYSIFQLAVAVALFL